MANLIEVRDASFSYHGKDYIWENVNLQVEQGDSVCILGANGCFGGSSTAKADGEQKHKCNSGEFLEHDFPLLFF